MKMKKSLSSFSQFALSFEQTKKVNGGAVTCTFADGGSFAAPVSNPGPAFFRSIDSWNSTHSGGDRIVGCAVQ
jgi:hypothetical protein